MEIPRVYFQQKTLIPTIYQLLCKQSSVDSQVYENAW